MLGDGLQMDFISLGENEIVLGREMGVIDIQNYKFTYCHKTVYLTIVVNFMLDILQ